MSPVTKEVRRALSARLPSMADVWVRTWRDGQTTVGLVAGAQTKAAMTALCAALDAAGYKYVRGMLGVVSGEYVGDYVVTLKRGLTDEQRRAAVKRAATSALQDCAAVLITDAAIRKAQGIPTTQALTDDELRAAVKRGVLSAIQKIKGGAQ